MNSVPVFAQGGIVVRRAALDEKMIDALALSEAMESALPSGYEGAELLSFGPSFGDEAMNEFTKRLTDLGLTYVDDFFCFSVDVPEWCGLRVELKSMSGLRKAEGMHSSDC